MSEQNPRTSPWLIAGRDIRAKYAKSQDKLANIEQSIQALG